MRRGRVELPNPWGLSDVDHADNSFDTSAKHRIYPVLDGTTGIFVTLGQSRITNNSAAGAVPYVVANPAGAINLNPYDGAYYVANDPVLGCSASQGYQNAGWHGQLCDKLIAAGKYTKVVVIPIGIGGSSVTEWTGKYKDRIRAVSAMLTAMALTPTAWLWQQGTTDSIDGMAQATYQTNLRSVIHYQRSQPGRSGDRWMIAIDTIHDDNLTSVAIRAAQSAVAADANNAIGPDVDGLTYPSFMDGLHFTAGGNNAVSGMWSSRIQAVY